MVKNQDIAKQILEMMDTAIEASSEMIFFLENKKENEYKEVYDGLHLLLSTIQGVALGLKEEETALNLPKAIVSVLISLERIYKISKNNIKRACHKLEYELIPLIEEMRIEFYYWGMVYPDSDKMKKYNEEDIYLLSGNKYISESENVGEYKYDLSIIVIAFNKIEYTKKCVNSLLENLPSNLRYEIILVNHGSSDGTKEFFEGVKPDKQVDIAINGAGLRMVHRIYEGKYRMVISNDIIITENAIDNLYKCITSDEKIAWVVPSTSNVSNLQSIEVTYTTEEELKKFVKTNNKSDFRRWEQRVRLCNPVDIVRSNIFNEYRFIHRYHSTNTFSFPDDKQALYYRRNGYKMYLVKDAYCHHFGSVTLKEDVNTNSAEAFTNGRKLFKNMYGIDPWSYGMCYSNVLFKNYKFNKKQENIKILAINCGLGSNPLKIKEEIKENTGNIEVKINVLTNQLEYMDDLTGIFDQVGTFIDYSNINIKRNEFDYIIFEDDVTNMEIFSVVLEKIKKGVRKKGIGIIRTNEKSYEEIIKKDAIYEKAKFIPEIKDTGWLIIENN